MAKLKMVIECIIDDEYFDSTEQAKIYLSCVIKLGKIPEQCIEDVDVVSVEELRP